MRKLLMLVIAAAFLLGLAVPVFCADLKVGYVDTIKVFNEYQRTKDYDKVLEEKQKIKEEERDKKVSELKKLQDQYVLLSDAEKEKKKADIEKMAQELDEFRRQAVLDLRKQQNDFMSEIVKEIDDLIKGKAKKEGYDYILNGQSIIFGKEAYDLTDAVLKELNKSYKPKK